MYFVVYDVVLAITQESGAQLDAGMICHNGDVARWCDGDD